MFARVTQYKMKSGTRDAATRLLEEVKPRIMDLPGMQSFLNVMGEDGAGYVISVSDSREVADGNADQVKAIWASFGDLLEAPPKPEGYDVIAHWTK